MPFRFLTNLMTLVDLEPAQGVIRNFPRLLSTFAVHHAKQNDCFSSFLVNGLHRDVLYGL